MQTTAADVTRTQGTTGYVFDYTDVEQERLIRQSAKIASITRDTDYLAGPDRNAIVMAPAVPVVA